MGRLTMNMLMSFAEFEREMISERTRDKIAGARRKGKWTGGPVPFGYSARDKKLVVNEAEAHIVREAFALFLAHRQMAVVARELNKRGLLPRSSKRGRKGGPLWSKDGIARVLRSPLYAGRMMYGDDLFDGEHPPLIDDVTYRQAQRLLGTTGRELRVTGTNPEYALRGLLRCGRCDEAMCPGSTTKKSGKTYRFYRCSTRDKYGTDRCSARPLPAGALEDLSWSASWGDRRRHTGRAPRPSSRHAAKERSTSRGKALSAQIAEASAATSKLTDDDAAEGRARAARRTKLRDRQPGSTTPNAGFARSRTTPDLELVEPARWFVAARNFGKVWGG